MVSKMVRPPTLPRSRAVPRLSSQTFSTTTPSRSALFNLNGLAHSRESQYLSKERGIPRTEFSSNIHLIRSSEVDPFPNAPGASKHANEFQHSSRKRAGRQATIVDETNEALVRNLMDNTHPVQQRKSIEALVVQLRAAREEIAHLRAISHRSHLGKADGYRRNHPRLVLVGGVALGLLVWAETQRHFSKEEAEKQAAEMDATAPVQTEIVEEAQIIDSEPVEIAESEPQPDPGRSHKRRSSLGFLWA